MSGIHNPPELCLSAELWSALGTGRPRPVVDLESTDEFEGFSTKINQKIMINDVQNTLIQWKYEENT